MAKKSSSHHSRPAPQAAKGVARRPQTPERVRTAMLVRAPGAADETETSTPSAANIVAEPASEVERAPRRAATPAATKPAPATRPAVKPTAAPRPAPANLPAATPRNAQPAKAVAPAASSAAPRASAVLTREQTTRIARARATQRARQANLIAAENYTYVLGDLKLVIGLAVTAFAVLIALAFVLPH